MTTPHLALPSESQPGPSRAWTAQRTQLSFDKSALVHPCSIQVIEESVLLPVCEELKDDDFTPSPSAPSHRASSTMVTAPSATDTAPSTTETAPDTDSGPNDHRGQKRAEASSDTSYSQEHRAMGTGPSNYPKRPHRLRTLTSSKEDEPPPRPVSGYRLLARSPGHCSGLAQVPKTTPSGASPCPFWAGPGIWRKCRLKTHIGAQGFRHE